MSQDGDLLQACNALLSEYVDTLVLKGTALRYIVPQYMCLLRRMLTQPMLRRYMQHIMPRLPYDVLSSVTAASKALLLGNVDVCRPLILCTRLLDVAHI